MTLRQALTGLVVIVGVTLIVTLGVFRAIDRPAREAFERERAQVVFATAREGELEGRYALGLEMLEISRGARFVLDRPEYDHGAVPGSTLRGTWTIEADRLTLVFEGGASELRFGHLGDEPVLVATDRLWRRVPRP